MGGAKPKKKGKPAPKAKIGGSNATQEEEEVKPHRNLYVKVPTGMDMTETKLTELFKACGDVTSVSLVTTSNHAFGFVEFATVPEAERGMEKLNGHEGMLVKFAKPQLFAAPVVAATVVLPAGEETEEEEHSEAPAKDTTVDHDCVVAAARRYPNPVGSLQAIVQKAIRATSTADCIVYTVAEVEDEWETLFVGTLQLKVPAGNASHSGKPRGNKQEAKKSAAEAALRDPQVHELLPALPPKVKEQQVVKAADSEEVEGDSTAEVVEGQEQEQKARAVQSTKKQKQLEKAELRAKKLAMRKAAKAAKAVAAENGEEEEEKGKEDSTDEGEDEESSANEDGEHSEESEEESEEDDSSDGEADEAQVAKRAAIKAALAARRAAAPQRVRPTAASKEKVVLSAAQKQVKKVARHDVKMANDGQETSKQENFGQTKFIKP